MKNGNDPAAGLSEATTTSTGEEVISHEKAIVNRRSFMRHSLVAGAAATVGSGLLANGNFAVAQDASGGKPTKGDVAILQFLAAAEIIESDLWLQYQELGGVQDDEVSSLASKLLPGYPAHFKFTHHVEPGPESLNLTDVPAYRLSICYIRSVFTSSLT